MTYKYSVKPYFKKPKRLASKPRLTIAQLARGVSNETRLKSKKVAIVSAEEVNAPAALVDYIGYRVITHNTENGHRYKLTIYSPTFKVKMDTKIIIDDPCPVFVFRYEYGYGARRCFR